MVKITWTKNTVFYKQLRVAFGTLNWDIYNVNWGTWNNSDDAKTDLNWMTYERFGKLNQGIHI